MRSATVAIGSGFGGAGDFDIGLHERSSLRDHDGP